MIFIKSGREISFYGKEYGELQCTNKNHLGINTLNDLFRVLLVSFSKSTTYPSCRNDYGYENDPTYGQCAITALIVQDFFQGEIMKIVSNDGPTHYFNRINNLIVDLTSDQFTLYGIKLSYSKAIKVEREYLETNNDTMERYRILLNNLSGIK